MIDADHGHFCHYTCNCGLGIQVSVFEPAPILNPLGKAISAVEDGRYEDAVKFFKLAGASEKVIQHCQFKTQN